jgi:hypothetical protein
MGDNHQLCCLLLLLADYTSGIEGFLYNNCDVDITVLLLLLPP